MVMTRDQTFVAIFATTTAVRRAITTIFATTAVRRVITTTFATTAVRRVITTIFATTAVRKGCMACTGSNRGGGEGARWREGAMDDAGRLILRLRFVVV